MNKNHITTLLVILLVFATIGVSIAKEFDSTQLLVNEKLSDRMTVQTFKDGRVVGIRNVEKLDDEQLNLVLERIGYSEKMIERLHIDRKRQLVRYGGKVKDVKVSELKREYISRDGNIHLKTPTNSSQIREMQLKDLEALGVSKEEINGFNVIEDNTENVDILSDFSATSTYEQAFKEDGIWSAVITVNKVGETSTQHEYMVSLDYFWAEQPKASHGDTAGLTWAPYGSPVANTAGGAHFYTLYGTEQFFDHNIDTSSNFGITTNFNVPNDGVYVTGKEQWGYIEEKVRVSKSLTGQQQTVSAAYSHPWITNNWGLSVGYGGLTFTGSLGMGDRWSWRVNFTP